MSPEINSNQSEIIYHDFTPGQRDVLVTLLLAEPNSIITSVDILEKSTKFKAETRERVRKIIEGLSSENGHNLPIISLSAVGYTLERPVLEHELIDVAQDVRYSAENHFLIVCGKRVVMTPLEENIFQVLLNSKNKVRTSKDFMNLVASESNKNISPNIWSYYLYSLKDKFGKDGERLLVFSPKIGVVFRDFSDENMKSIITEDFIYYPEMHILKQAKHHERILSPIMSSILELFLNNQGKRISTIDIISEIWPHKKKLPQSYIALYISYLRNYIEIDPSNPKYLRSIMGPNGGYILEI